MDRKSVAILIVSFALLMSWPMLINKIYPPKPAPPRNTNQISLNATSSAPSLAATATNTLGQANTNLATRTPATPGAPERFLIISNAYAHYTFTSRGGGLKLVELREYPEISCDRNNTNGGFATLNTFAPAPVLEWAGNEERDFQLTSMASGVRAERQQTNGLALVKEFQLTSNYLISATVRLENRSGQPLQINAQEWSAGTATPLTPKDDPLLTGVVWFNGADVSELVNQPWFENRSFFGCAPGTPRPEYRVDAPNARWTAAQNQFFTLAVMPASNALPSQVVVREVAVPPLRLGTNIPAVLDPTATVAPWLFTPYDFIAPADFANRLRNAQDPLAAWMQARLSDESRRLLGAYAGGDVPAPLLTELVSDLNKTLRGPSIFAQNMEYYARVPLKGPTRRLIAQHPAGDDLVRLNRLVLDEAFPGQIVPSPLGFEVALAYPALALAPGEFVVRHYTIYAGPKEYSTLTRIAAEFNNQLDLVMNYHGFFGFFARILLLSMNGLHSLGLGYGLAIIGITIIVKLLFWPLTQASTRSMKRMQALQPQVKALQEKYKEDPAKMQKKMMELWREHKVNPLGGCLPLLLQLPVFFGFYRMIQSAIELRGAKFLWACDLSKPDTLFTIPGLGWIPFIGVPGAGLPFNPLPLLMGATMLWQARLQPVSPGMDPAQQKIMKYMPLMFLFILYNFSAGLTLYWTVQNLLTIAQMKLTKAKDEPAAVAVPAAATMPKKKKK